MASQMPKFTIEACLPRHPEDVSRYNKHRFDNHSAWMDMQIRRDAQARGNHQGWGFAELQMPPKPKKEKHFHVCEPSMTSGEMVLRKVPKVEKTFPLEDERVSLHHYPNYKNVKDEDHYEDWRARSQHIDPSRRKAMPKDKVLSDAVTDEMVQGRILAEKADNRKPVDAKLLALRFAEVQLDAESVRELQKEHRVDWSCTNIPSREDPKRLDAPGVAVSKRSWAMSGSIEPPPDIPKHPDVIPGEIQQPKQSDAKWSWCLGKPQFDLGRQYSDDHEHKHRALVKSNSLPKSIPGRTLLPGASLKEPQPFQGVHNRPGIYGTKVPDMRMRGSTQAREGFAGTFPEWEAKK